MFPLLIKIFFSFLFNYYMNILLHYIHTTARKTLHFIIPHRRIHPIAIAKQKVHGNGLVNLRQAMQQGRERPGPRLEQLAERSLPASVRGRYIVVQIVAHRVPEG